MRKLLLVLALLGALGGARALLAPPPARAAGLSPPVADCEAHGRLTHHYPPAELRQALATMPADVAQYSNCSDVINRALLAELGGLSGGVASGGGGSFLPAWAIAVLAVVVLAGAGAGAVALRNRRREG